MKKQVYFNIFIGIASIVIAYVFYYFISMDLINQFYPVNEQRGFVLYICHVIFFYILMKLIVSVPIYKVDKVLAAFVYVCILYIALFDRITLAQRIINVNPISGFMDEGILQMVLNVIVFFPFYTMLKWFTHFNKKQKFMMFILFVFLVEIMQYISMRGIFDITDILLNTIGYGCGIKLYDVFFHAENR